MRDSKLLGQKKNIDESMTTKIQFTHKFNYPLKYKKENLSIKHHHCSSVFEDLLVLINPCQEVKPLVLTVLFIAEFIIIITITFILQYLLTSDLHYSVLNSCCVQNALVPPFLHLYVCVCIERGKIEKEETFFLFFWDFERWVLQHCYCQWFLCLIWLLLLLLLLLNREGIP